MLRPFSGGADHVLVEELWLAALAGRWPLLPRAVAMVRDGYLAVEDGRAVGFAAVDRAGSRLTPGACVVRAEGRRYHPQQLSKQMLQLGIIRRRVGHDNSCTAQLRWWYSRRVIVAQYNNPARSSA